MRTKNPQPLNTNSLTDVYKKMYSIRTNMLSARLDND